MKNKGFTLTELMIVVAIVGILASVAYPSYVNHVTTSSRLEAMNALLDVANRQEQFFADNHAYTTVLNNIGVEALTETGLYRISIVSDGTTFTATATPEVGTVVADDAACAAFNITDAGLRGATGKLGRDCWN